MYRHLSDVLGVECFCNKEVPPTGPLLGMTEGNVDLQNKIRQVWQERVEAQCQRDSVGVSPGYLEGKEWTDNELKVLAQEDFETVDEVDEVIDDDDIVEDVGDSTGVPNDPTRLVRPENDPDRKYHFEACGLTHLVHAWVASGHQNSPKAKLVPSAQMLGAGTAYRSAAVKSHLYNTRILHAYAAMCLRRTIPSEYDKAKPIYDAGKWISEDSPDGIALGRAILWKLQVAIHRDTQDGLGNFCIAFNFGRWVPDGMFGGGMAFPDLGLMFEYPPGSILIFRSADLFHGVMPWQPAHCRGDSITPGRVSWVLFTSQAARRILDGKPPGWLVKTNQGDNKYQVQQLELQAAADLEAKKVKEAKDADQLAKAAKRKLARQAKGKAKEDAKKAKTSASTSTLNDVE
ncbi:hypothetical protein SISSUDRAFT_1038656 [Sistotremastrum suecicum HHB10207 ss-3]|uniref:Uncharacterized protein n=1 Tax=Sistotremastrum suecicum HHB10207 ss-3 TaxID=1314776 RepID=A0A165WH90_9AGAM|nr:hypothetical protein SISSUDRAFT_1038656 [Sistotremastrum suecicum HHB10207 ss-3]